MWIESYNTTNPVKWEIFMDSNGTSIQKGQFQ